MLLRCLTSVYNNISIFNNFDVWAAGQDCRLLAIRITIIGSRITGLGLVFAN